MTREEYDAFEVMAVMNGWERKSDLSLDLKCSLSKIKMGDKRVFAVKTKKEELTIKYIYYYEKPFPKMDVTKDISYEEAVKLL